MGKSEFDTPPENLEEEVNQTPTESETGVEPELDAETETDSSQEGKKKEGVTLSKKQMKKLEELAQKADAMEKELKETSDKYLRLLAEYDNYRKRTQKEKEAIYGDTKASAILALLPIYDNLARALAQETEDAAFYKGVEMTMNQCKAAFESLGASEIPALGEQFDPKKHNAVMHVEDDSVAENTVVEVFQTGFAMGDKVIRVAMVKVAN